MKKYSVYSALFMALWCLFFAQCKKNKTVDCTLPDIIPYQPYASPVWHPNGQLLGFNHTPQTGVSAQGSPPCVWYMNGVNQDSAGFYLINKDGTGFRRITSFYLGSPSWSPDGNWIAFSEGPAIYKIHFDGHTFDTTHIVQLTDSGANYFPCWTANSDTIYFDSNNDAPEGTSFYSIWKMSSDGSGKTRLTQSAGIGDSRQPYVGSNNRVYYVSYASGTQEVFSMNKNGSDKIQLTFITKSSLTNHPKYFRGKIFYWSDGYLYSSDTASFAPEKILISTDGEDYSISPQGQLVYVAGGFPVYDQKFETLWTANIDGENQIQLTFNNH